MPKRLKDTPNAAATRRQERAVIASDRARLSHIAVEQLDQSRSL
jgi:hypothetical protein